MHFERRYLHDLGYGSGKEYSSRFAASVATGDVILDLGYGEGGLRRLLPPGVNYVGLDLYRGAQSNEYSQWHMRPTILGDIHSVPLADQSVATVALNHVLEHARDPIQVMREIARVLRTGGFLFMDVPFLHDIHHAPHGYYRYTPYALRELAPFTGFDVIEIRPSGGYCRALAHILGEATTVFVARGWVRYGVAYPLRALGWLLGRMQYMVDVNDRA